MHVASIVFLLALAAPAAALTGREVVDQAQRKHGFSTWKDRTASADMRSYTGDTLARERTFDVSEQTDPAGAHKTFMAFTGPTDLAGTTFLHLSPRGERDQQWLWTPTTRRVRRLAEAQQDENFFGSDLSYRDLELLVRIQQWTDAESTATLDGEETVDGKACNVVVLEPKNPEFPWSKYKLWFGKDDSLPWRLDIYDKDKVQKRVTVAKYQTVDGHATPVDATIANPGENTKTVMTSKDVKYNTDVGDDLFTVSALGRTD